MYQGNRVYEDAQVQFSPCSCLRQMLGENRQSNQPGQQIICEQPNISQHVDNRRKQKNRVIGLKLAKNLRLPTEIKQDCVQQLEYLQTHQHIHQKQIQSIKVFPIIQAMNAHKMNIPYAAGKHNYLQSNKHVTFAESHLIQASYDYHYKIPNIHSEDKNILQIGQLNKNNNLLRQTALFTHQSYLHPANNGKVNSTSSTTLFETRKNIEESHKQQNMQMAKRTEEKKEKEKQKNQNKIWKPAERVNNSMYLNISDFSRVREVETVMSSDSFSISLLDVGSELPNQDGLNFDNLLQNRQIEVEMKRLLFN